MNTRSTILHIKEKTDGAESRSHNFYKHTLVHSLIKFPIDGAELNVAGMGAENIISN